MAGESRANPVCARRVRHEEVIIHQRAKRRRMSAADLTDTEVRGLVEALRHVSAAVVVVDTSARVIYSNEWAKELTKRHLRRPMPEYLDRGWEIFRLDGRRYHREEYSVVRSITSGEQIRDEEYFHPREDGGRLVVRCCSAPVFDEQQRIVAGMLVMVDITADKRVQERLSYFDRLLENTEDAIVGTDADFRLDGVERRAERLFGYTAGDGPRPPCA